LPEFNARRIRIVAVSIDSPDVSEHLRQVTGYSFPILCDTQLQVIRAWDLVHPHAGIRGADIARPAEFLLDANRKVLWRDLTDDYLIRTRPEQVLRASDASIRSGG
jgi:peroxiredoxin